MNGHDQARADRLFRLLIGVYLGGGLLNSIVNLLVPRLRITLGLDYAQALCVHLAYYSSYLVFALPITLWSMRLGYMRAIAVGLATMAAGCLFFVVAQGERSFALVLASLLVMSSGVTFLQISGNAVTTAFGPSARMAPRFTLLQAFNSFGTVIGPLVGAWFLLGQGGNSAPILPFVVGAGGLVLLAGTFWAHRRMFAQGRSDRQVWPRVGIVAGAKRMRFGALAIFVYVGAEVTIGTLAVNYLMLDGTLHLSAVAAGQLVSLYWAGALVGRFAGSFALRRIGPVPILGGACLAALILLAVAIAGQGMAGAVALLAVGLCNSVMFPLTYALALPDDADDAPIAAMLLCMAVVGGAVVPVLTGLAADQIGLPHSFVVPALCYLVIFGFARSRRPAIQGIA
ncbi:MFS transporter [Sphingomonas chungangi]|uniref:MFS transporter n=1 Tax=Sphingomonas chungangi TaxID=2683589 RepID=UPI0031B57B45